MRSIILLLVLSAAITSCTSMYIPHPPSAPLLKHGGDVRLAANTSLVSMTNLNASVALTGNVVLTGEASFDPITGPGMLIPEKGNLNADIGLGYMMPFGEKWLGELIVGGGFGSGRMLNNAEDLAGTVTFRQAEYKQAYAQAAIMYDRGDAEFVYQLRTTALFFDRYRETELHKRWLEEGIVVNVIEGFPNTLIWEHTFLRRLEVMKDLDAQVFVNISHYTGPARQTIHAGFNVGGGISYRFGEPRRQAAKRRNLVE